ncbi:SbcC/MukB-like Walker B domain-containing protein [Streptomyces afghaniensis]|uniref:SbcC/MukB-like Walker B domain-containing protein n=1 Tax=Streptomyces afghaniensis TaxID=66865 RepID=UPI002783D305|nr:SbcC/MukB-like Walker B domain-containing protein [Streptomyces afghaniensis]MDQ1019867.1 regulator of replication initiation timing [Streptomyces afghaniensis]
MNNGTQTAGFDSRGTASEALSPDHLLNWREAAVSGGLPDPTRTDRWQQLRAGVVNMWEFEVAEFWASGGRSQLMGRNETGKSTLMTLTTLIMLAGNTGPHLIDTLGDGKKRFRYYVEPTDSDKDRRDASKSVNRGWIWVEYGRMTTAGPEYVTALLYTEAKRAKTGRPSLTWAVCEGPARVRDGILLVKGAAIVPAGDLESTDGWHRCDSAEDYKRHLARLVFNSDGTALDSYVRMLRVIRTPKLGERLDMKFLSEQLRMAFPPLKDHEIRQLAEGWDQLEKITNDRDSAQQARDALSAFNRRAWTPWAGATVRYAADNVVAANSSLDEITRKARSEGERRDTAVEKINEIDEESSRQKRQRDDLLAEQGEIQRRDAYANAEAAQERARTLAEEAERHADDAARQDTHAKITRGSADQAQEEAKQLSEAVAGHEEKIQEAAQGTGQLACEAGFSEAVQQWIIDGDDARAQASYEARRKHLDHLRGLLGDLQNAQHNAAVKDSAVRTLKEADDRAGKALGSAIEDADAELQRLVDHIGQWSVDLSDPPSEQHVRAWTEVVGRLRGKNASPVLRQLIDQGFLEPRREQLMATKKRAEATAEALQKQVDEKQKEVDRLQSQPDEGPPGPYGWVRRDRPSFPSHLGAPLWRLVDPADGTDAAELGIIEAALAAAGLLDAWVTTDGRWDADRDGIDAVVSPGSQTVAGTSLAAVLTPAADSGALADSVTTMLSSIAWITTEPLPSKGSFIAADGRWSAAGMAGQCEAPAKGACYIGIAARQAHREQRIATLINELHALAVQIDEAKATVQIADDGLSRVRAVAADAPDDSTLVTLVRAVSTAEKHKDDTAGRLAAEQQHLGDLHEKVAEARRAASTWREAHRLPQADEQLHLLQRQLDALSGRLQSLHTERRVLQGERQNVRQAEGIAEREAARATEEETKARELRQKADFLEVQARTALDALSKDGRNLLARVQEIDMLLEEQSRSAELRQKARAQYAEERMGAEAQLGLIEEEREKARHVREYATADWNRLVDGGLPEAFEIETAQTPTTSNALEAARAARATITLVDWPERDAHAQNIRIQRAWRKLAEETTQLRSILEVNAGRTVRIIESDEPNELPSVEVVVDSSGIGYSPRDALIRLAQQHEELQRGYDQAWHETLDKLLGSTFIEHLRDRLETVHSLEKTINETLAQHPTGTSRITLRLRRAPLEEDPHGAEVLDALSGETFDLLPTEAQDQIQFFLRSRVEEAQRRARDEGETDWRGRLTEVLDYRRWFTVVIDSRIGTGRWTPLERDAHGELSGGARVVTLMLPLVAALATMYQGTPTGPRPLWLDEAFDGVDGPNRSSVLGLLHEFDMDYLLAGPGPLVNTASVPSAAMYEVVRAPHPLPGADLTLMLWAAGRMDPIELPDPAHLAARAATIAAREAQEPAPDLFSTAGELSDE